MKTLFLKLKRLNYRHYICAGITLLLILLNIFVFPYSFPRIWESLIDFGTSCAYYFKEITQLNFNVEATVNSFSKLPLFFCLYTQKSAGWRYKFP